MRPIRQALVGLAALLVAAAGARAQQPAAPCCTVTIRVTVPESTGTVYLAGSLPELGPWRPDGRALTGAGRERSVQVTAPSGTTFEYKFTLGTWDREAVGPSGATPPNNRLVINGDVEVVHDIPGFKREQRDYVADWQGSGVLGRLIYWKDYPSAFLGPVRNIVIWLPPGYDSARNTRYPVLYMSDGQNLFDPRIAFTGVDWGVDEAVVRLSQRGVIPPVIVVGAWSTAERSTEYSPWHRADAYARFLIEELMPQVNREFRTRTGPRNTGVMGSSMGGLLSFYLVTYHPEAFGACGCESTHFPISEAVVQGFPGVARVAQPDTTPYIVRDIAAGLRPPRRARYRFDFGSLGLDSAYGPTHEVVRAWLLRNHLVEGRDFVIRRYEGATHNEASWRARLDDPLTFMFGAEPRAASVSDERLREGSLVQVHVTNRYEISMEVSVTGGGMTYRLGLVAPGIPRTFTLPPAMTGSGGQLEFFAQPTGLGPVIRTFPIAVSPGDEVDFEITTHLTDSRAVVRH